MPPLQYLWLLLCYAQYARGDLVGVYKDISERYINPKVGRTVPLPIDLGVDRYSGCICRASIDRRYTICFGGYDCRRMPKVGKTNLLRLRTSGITKIRIGDLDRYYFLKVLELESNHQLQSIEPGAFRNLSNLEQLSISYSTSLAYIHERTFEGLTRLKNLTMVNDAFSNIKQITSSLPISILPSLEWLDLTENIFERITKDAFMPMKGSKLKRLEINLCQVDYIDPESLLPLKMLKELVIGENELSPNVLGQTLANLSDNGINLSYLDISGLGFRKSPPRLLLNIIAQTTIKELVLAQNQFEVIMDASFPKMGNIEVLDLSKVSAVYIAPNAFNEDKFPNLRSVYLTNNYLAGVHSVLRSKQIRLLDLSYNTQLSVNTVYFEIGRGVFTESNELKILNLSFNTIKSIYNYTFLGLYKLKVLNLENGTIYHIGDGSFKTMPALEVLNFGNNPITASETLRSAQFKGLSNLNVLILRNCGIKFFRTQDNIFSVMPKITHLILKNNQLFYLTRELLSPLTKLKVLDVSNNLFVDWGQTLFYPNGPMIENFYLTNNKLSHFSISMFEDIAYLLNDTSSTAVIDLSDNIFVCDCNTMYTALMWIETNGSHALRHYFNNANFQCSSPDVWEDRTVADYFKSIKSVRCIIYNEISSAVMMAWTTPTIILIVLILSTIFIGIRYRAYIKYWLFLAKLALGRRFKTRSRRSDTNVHVKIYKYDAFVSYCNEDREMVSEMISHLESEQPFLKLCVYERDFEIGSFISESILNSINESRYIILMVSDAFAKSQWCRWETQLAEYHRLFLEDGTGYDPLIIVRVGNIENKHLTPTLKYLLKTKIYLSWNEDNSEEFWKKLRSILVKK